MKRLLCCFVAFAIAGVVGSPAAMADPTDPWMPGPPPYVDTAPVPQVPAVSDPQGPSSQPAYEAPPQVAPAPAPAYTSAPEPKYEVPAAPAPVPESAAPAPAPKPEYEAPAPPAPLPAPKPEVKLPPQTEAPKPTSAPTLPPAPEQASPAPDTTSAPQVTETTTAPAPKETKAPDRSPSTSEEDAAPISPSEDDAVEDSQESTTDGQDGDSQEPTVATEDEPADDSVSPSEEPVTEPEEESTSESPATTEGELGSENGQDNVSTDQNEGTPATEEPEVVVVEAPEEEAVVPDDVEVLALPENEAVDPEEVSDAEVEQITALAAQRGSDRDDRDRNRDGRDRDNDRDRDRDRDHDRDRDRGKDRDWVKPWQKDWKSDRYGRPVIVVPRHTGPVFLVYQEHGHWRKVPLRPGVRNPINTCTTAGLSGYVVVNHAGVSLGGGTFVSNGHCYNPGWRPPHHNWHPPVWHPPAQLKVRFEVRFGVYVSHVPVTPLYYRPHEPVGRQYCVLTYGHVPTWGQYYVPAPVRGHAPILWTPNMPTEHRYFVPKEHRETIASPVRQGPPPVVEYVGGEASSLPQAAPDQDSGVSRTVLIAGFGGSALVLAAAGWLLWRRRSGQSGVGTE